MPRRPSFVVSRPKEGVFLVHVPASLSMRGKLERRTFKDAKDAEKFAAKLRTAYHRGIRGGVVDPGTVHNTTEAEKAIREAGLNVSVIEAVRSYLEARQMLAPFNVSIGEVAKGWVKARKARGDDRTFREAAAEFINEQEMQWSPKYLKNIQKTFSALPEWFLETRLPDVDEAMMLRAVKEKVNTPTYIETRMRHVRSLFNREGKKKRTKRKPAILTDTQCAAMLRACRSREEVRAVSLLLFAGIRPDSADGEITKLDWSTIKDGAVYVPAEVSKTGTDRIVPIRPRLARLIKGHPTEGRVMPTAWPKRIQAIRKAAGMNDQKYQDSTRHTFASHHLVAFGEAATQAAMGHTEGSRTLFRHYRQAVTEEAGKRYFGGKVNPNQKGPTK